MSDADDYPRGKQAAQKQTREIGRNNEANHVRRKTFNLGAHSQQGRKQTVGEQQQAITEQQCNNGTEGFEQVVSSTGRIPDLAVL